MYVLFEESGKFHAGRVMSEADSSMQVELDSGKRVKVKANNVMLKFEKPQPAEFISSAQRISGQIDLDLAWTFAPEDEFGFAELARDYFDAQADLCHQAAALFCLFDAPHYFRRLGKGQFKKAPEEIVKAALLGIERKKLLAAQVEAWTIELIEGKCPPAVQDQLYKILFKPDKNSPEYKSVVEASKRSQKAPLDLLTQAGAITSPYQFHWKRFLFENFPRGTQFPTLTAPDIRESLSTATVQAFSIDDSATTEIDDALSVQGLGSGTVVFGVHIAAPGLAIAPDSPIDKVARDRMSTVYMPGHKLTMLPDHVVEIYTLKEGRSCPAVSLYVTLDESTLEIKSAETRLETVPIALNMRHDQLDGIVTESSLTGVSPASYPFAYELAFAFRLANHLKSKREIVRGKPENFNRPDYNFHLEGVDRTDSLEPQGHETVSISVRRRGAPLDLIVAEAMILANSTWGGWLNEFGVPGIYRSQASLAPGIKVRMSTKAAPHMGMGVAQYTWATSPLRRYVDLVNQWQLIACAKYGRTAALAAPFKHKDTTLFAIISSFDTAYASYNGFQSSIERYWMLKYLEQNHLEEFNATVMKDGLVRADDWPLVLRATGTESLPRNAHVKVRVTGFDLLTLDVHAQLLARLDDAPTSDVNSDIDEPEDAPPSVTVNLAIDLQDSTQAPTDSSVTAT